MADRSLFIEIVLDDKGAVGKLAQVDGALRKVGAGAQTGEKDLSKFESAMTRATAVGTFLGHTLYNAVATALSFLAGELGRAVTLSSQATAAFMGLSSVAGAFGANITEAKNAAARLSQDGLMKVSEAALGLKNLLASGFSLPQAVKLMEAFKDSAAFGRQASLDFGYAVVSATEGIKNQNSILVDNAGVTKNLSVILREAGFSVDALGRVSTDAKVRMALFNGILKETAAQTGDAERLTQTYSGAVSKLKTQYEFGLATLGAAITENKTVATVITFVSDVVMKLNSDLTHNGRAFTIVSDIVIGVVKGFSLLLTVVDYVQKAFFVVKAAAFAVIQAFVNLNGALDTMILGILETIAKVPGATTVFGNLNEKIAATKDRLVHGKAAFDQYTTEINTNLNAADANSAAIGRFQSTLGTLVSTLQSTRGETVQLGGAQQRLKADTNAAEGAASSHATALHKQALAAREAGNAMLSLAQNSAGWAFTGLGMGLNRQPLADPKALPNAGNQYDYRRDGMTTAPSAIASEMASGAGATVNSFKALADSLDRVVEGFTQLAQIGGKTFGGIVQSIGTATGAVKSAVSGFDLLKKGIGAVSALGGGAAAGAAGAVSAGGSIMGLVGSIGMVATGVGAIVPLAMAAYSGLKKLFGVSAKEQAGRTAAGDFRADLEATLDLTQKLEAGGEKWKMSVIAIRDAYLKVGATEQEALAISQRLWEAEKQGPEAVNRIIQEISRTLTSQYLPESQQATAIAALGWSGVVDLIEQATTATDAATDATKASTAATQAQAAATRDLAAAEASRIAALEASRAAAGLTPLNNNDALSPGSFASYEDWFANWILRNPGDEGRAGDAYRSHWGGPVRAHSGLAIDEVGIIAQRGEGIVNRHGMRRLGRAGLHGLNHGGTTGGGDVAAAIDRLCAAIADRPVVVEIDGEEVARASTTAVRRRVGVARRY